MRAAFVRAHGGPEVIEITDRPRPAPRGDEVLVEVKAAALNHLDVWVRRGVPGHKFPLPMILGCDGAGVVAEVGNLVTSVKPGARVAIAPGFGCGTCTRCVEGNDHLCRGYGIFGETRDGTCAEFVAIPARNVLPMPAGMSFADAASVPLTFLTAWNMLLGRCALQAGEDVLVHAAGSGVSIAAIQIAKLFGARVFATASSPAKLERAKALGADVVIDYKQADVAAVVREATQKAGLDVVVDHVGESTIGTSLKMLKKGGRVVTCGATSGPRLESDLRLIFFKSLSLLGSTMGGLGAMHRVWGLVCNGRLHPVIDRSVPLDRVGEGHAALEERSVFGKVIVTVGA